MSLGKTHDHSHPLTLNERLLNNKFSFGYKRHKKLKRVGEIIGELQLKISTRHPSSCTDAWRVSSRLVATPFVGTGQRVIPDSGK